MNAKELLCEIIEYLSSKYVGSGMKFAEQSDGCLSSKTNFVLNCKSGVRFFKIILTEKQKDFD